jgi:hypothetical protein
MYSRTSYSINGVEAQLEKIREFQQQQSMEALSLPKLSSPELSTQKVSNITTLIGRRSDDWIPLRVDKCEGLDPFSAPCLAKTHKSSNLITAEELIYRPFKLRLPRFINEIQKQDWMRDAHDNVERMRISNDETWATYPAFYGQNLVFDRSAYRNDPPPDTWSENACMGGDEGIRSFFTQVFPFPLML